MWPLIGRDDELNAAIEAVLAPDCFGVVVIGEAGVGKSRLSSEILAAVARDCRGARIVGCAATRATATIPFGAVADLLPDVPAALDTLVGVLRAAVQSFGPFDAERPTLIGIDDAHLADDASAALIHHLVTRRVAKAVVTVRAGEVPPDAITALWKDGHCARVDIAPLKRAQVDDLLAAALGGPVEDRTADRLWELSQGNPLLLKELVAEATTDQSLERRGGEWRWSGRIRPHNRLVDVVTASIGRLSDDERTCVGLLAYAGVLGLAALEAMVGGASAGTLLDRGIARLDVDGRRQQIALAHPLYGEVLRASLPAGEARRLLRLLAVDLMSRSPKRASDAGRLATWGIGAGMPVSLETLEQAARDAYRAGDAEGAEAIARADPSWRTHATGFILGAALGNQRRYEESLAVLAEASAAPPSEELLARIAYFRMEILSARLDRFDEAAMVFATAMADLTDPVWRDLVAAAWGPSLVEHGYIQEALDLLQPMSESPEPRTRVAAVRGMAYVDVPAGRTQRTIESADALLRHALSMPSEWTYGLFDVAGARMISLLLEGRLSETMAMLDLADTLGDSVSKAEARPFADVLRGRVFLFQGKPRSAIGRLRAAAAGFGRLNYGVREAWALRLLGEAHALLGDDAAAEAAVMDAAQASQLGTDPFESDGVRAAAWVPAARGHIATARQSLLETAAGAARLGRFAFEALALHDAARLGGAPEASDRLADLVAVVDGPIVRAYAEHARGLVAADGATLDSASEQFRLLGFNLVAAEAAMAASRAHSAAGLRARASASAARAAALRAECEGASTPSLALGDGAVALTRREREVAALAARLYPSREIADALGLSVRTVDNHLQRAFVKLGISRREDLAEVLGVGTAD